MLGKSNRSAVLFLVLFSPRLAAAGESRPPGEEMFRGFLREEVMAIAGRSLQGLPGREDWEARRPRLRRELREMLGLLPEPPRGDLRAVVAGVLTREELEIAVEKIHFQSLPGLYVTANLYRPRNVEGRLPAVLYLCGHGQVRVEGVPMGAKAHYQHHPTWLARNGFLCLVIDTLCNGEINGVHHGTYQLGAWWWVSRGYTPAGVEAWNTIRALDYLESRPEVDASRLGVTGRSGGGIGTWWIAALDDRPLALAPVAGITDLENHVVDGALDGHCDCNYPVNLHRWDYPEVAALAAPRPLLFSNSDKDGIFPLDGVIRIHRKLREVYRLLGAADRLGLLITEGPHADTQELQVPVFRWMDRWLRGAPPRPVAVLAEKHFDPRDLKVFAELPSDERNSTIQESFVPAAPAPAVPADAAGLEALRAELMGKLREKTFRNSPDPDLPLQVELSGEEEKEGFLLRVYRFVSERSVRLPIWVATPSGRDQPRVVKVRVVDERGWAEWMAGPGAAFTPGTGAALAVLPPRGVGPTRAWDDPKKENGDRRRLLAIGRTLEETWVHDTRRAVRALLSLEPFARAEIHLEGRGVMAGIALYAGLLEPGVASFDLRSLPASHQEGVALLNVLRVLDIPQAVALLFPRKVSLSEVPENSFEWTRRAAALFSGGGRESPLTFRPAASPATQ